MIVEFNICPLCNPFRYHHGQPQVLFPCRGMTASGQQWWPAPTQGPLPVPSYTLLLHSGPCLHLSLLASGLCFSPPFLQEYLPFLLCPQPRAPPAPFRPTTKPGLSNLSSILSSNSVTKKKTHDRPRQSYVHILYIFNQHEFNHMYILVSIIEVYVICLICINIPHVHTAVHTSLAQCDASTLKDV